MTVNDKLERAWMKETWSLLMNYPSAGGTEEDHDQTQSRWPISVRDSNPRDPKYEARVPVSVGRRRI